MNTHPTLSSLIIQPRPKVSIASLTRVLLLAIFLSATSRSSPFTSIAVGTLRIAIPVKAWKDYPDPHPKSYSRIQEAPNLFAPIPLHNSPCLAISPIRPEKPRRQPADIRDRNRQDKRLNEIISSRSTPRPLSAESSVTSISLSISLGPPYSDQIA